MVSRRRSLGYKLQIGLIVLTCLLLIKILVDLQPKNQQVSPQFILLPPSVNPYNLTYRKDENPSQGQIQHIKDILLKLGRGIFIECGAHNGEHNSNTLWLERNAGWTGLLIEPDPTTFQELKTKNRKAWIANVCLSSHPYPEKLVLYQHNISSRSSVIFNKGMGMVEKENITVQCAPLETLLRLTGFRHVDLFSLDVEGFELDILRGIDFSKMSVKIFIIEYAHVSKNGGREELHEIMTRESYQLFYNQTSTEDLIYFHSSLTF